MDINQQKEQFSNTYVRAVATVAGCSLYRPDVDNDSVDLGLAARGGTGPIVSPRLELQLKCTSRDVLSENEREISPQSQELQRLKNQCSSAPHFGCGYSPRKSS